MIYKNFIIHVKTLLTILVLAHGLSFNAFAESNKKNCRVLVADRVFDGFNLLENAAVLFKGNKIIQVGEQNQFKGICDNTMDLGDATILPGFIESHAHLTFQNIPNEIVLRHNITTARDTGGPLLKPQGDNGKLRLLSTGPIIQAVAGYPLNILGHNEHSNHDKYATIGVAVETVAEAEKVVEDLVAGGATTIKIALAGR